MKDNYIVIQSWMVRDLKLSGNELIVYALIHGFCQDGKSYFYGSLSYLVEETNLSKRNLVYILQSLQERNLIKGVTQKGKITLYYTTISRSEEISEEKSDLDQCKNCTSEKNTSVPVQNLHQCKNCTTL